MLTVWCEGLQQLSLLNFPKKDYTLSYDRLHQTAADVNWIDRYCFNLINPAGDVVEMAGGCF